MHEKKEVLEYGADARKMWSAPPRRLATKPITQHIASISDDRDWDALLDSAIDACSHQASKLELLLHGALDSAQISTIENRIRGAAIDNQRFQTGVDVAGDLINDTHDHPSLTLLVARPDDASVKVRIEEVIPERGGRIPVPLVLIPDRSSSSSTIKSVT